MIDIKRKYIIEGNKLVAEFMNETFLNREEYAKEMDCPEDEIINMPSCNCFYHSDWNWLLPVIGKISNQCEEPEELDGLKYALLCNDIDTAFKFVVDYIKYGQ